MDVLHSSVRDGKGHNAKVPQGLIQKGLCVHHGLFVVQGWHGVTDGVGYLLVDLLLDARVQAQVEQGPGQGCGRGLRPGGEEVHGVDKQLFLCILRLTFMVHPNRKYSCYSPVNMESLASLISLR